MVIDSIKLQGLIDMGIEKDVAVEALHMTNNDLEMAANYIFTGELHADSTIIDNQESFQEKKNTEADTTSLEADCNSIVLLESDTGSSVIDSDASFALKSKISDPTIIFPSSKKSLYENYFALFALIIANYFPSRLISSKINTIPYDKDWFKDNTLFKEENQVINTDNSQEIVSCNQNIETDLSIINPNLILQFQKLLAIVNTPTSNRKFISAKIFDEAFSPDLKQMIDEYEHLYEVFPRFVESIIQNVEHYGDDHDIKKLFISKAVYIPSENTSPQSTFLSILHFLPDEYDSNLYKMFNALMLSNEDEPLHETNSLDDLAPILTIVFNETDDRTDLVNLSHGVDIPFEFYPQLYTKESQDQLVNNIFLKRKELKKQTQVVLNKLNDLKSFQGRQISGFINSAIDYVDGETLFDNDDSLSILTTLQDLKEQLKSSKQEKMKSYTNLLHTMKEITMSHPERYVIEKAKNLGIIDFPYLLSMVIISPYYYFLRTRDNKWFSIKSNSQESDLAIDQCTDYEYVRLKISENTCSPSELPLMFVYIKSNEIDNDDLIQTLLSKNEVLQNFIRLDQNSLDEIKK